MQFILKLFKALNSAQTPWQVTLAITLGMVAGLTPLSGIQTIVIFFLAFVLNIHLGLFFVSSAVFAGIGYLFDPIFEQIGYALLTGEGLNGLWTAWYNNGLIRLSYFNNTLVLGSTVVALTAAVPLYFLLGWAINHYRDALGSVLSKYPKLGFMGILKASDKKDPLLRWWGAGLFAGVAALLIAFAMLVADPLVKWALESGGSKVLQRDLRIGSVDVGFGEGSVDINRLEVAGSKEGIDAVSMEHIGFDIGLNALLFNRTHIEKIVIEGMGFETEATLKKSVASRDEAAETGVSEPEGGEALSMPAMELPDPETVLANADLKSLKVYDEAQNEITRVRTKWDDVAKDEFSQKALKAFENDYELIKKKASSKDPKQLLELKDDIAAFKKRVDDRKERIASLQREFKADKRRIKTLMAEMKRAPVEDYRDLQSTYSLDGSGAMNVVGTIFGEKVKGYMAMAEKYYKMAAPYLKSEKKAEEAAPPRGEGRWVKFANRVPSPDLLIAKTEIDGLLNSQSFAATINNISDNQKASGRPVTFSMESDGEQISGLKLSGEDNRLGEGVIDRLNFSATKLSLETMALSSMTLSNTALAFNGDLLINDAATLSGKIDLGFSNANIEMNNLQGKTAEAVADVLKSINRFSADVTLDGELKSPEVGVKTDLDKKLSGALSAGLKKQATAYKKELRGLLDSKMEEQLGSLSGEAANIADINALAGGQSSALEGLDANAGDLISGESGLKSFFPF
ncbi:MAG: TIGR03545 family protein [Campylobacterota bacterium]|nr:TIGR03545 family protein [Campylobacterota bacterium]